MWRFLPQRAHASDKGKIPRAIHAKRASSLDRHGNYRWVRTRVNEPVVLQPPVAPIEDEIDAGIHAAIRHAGIRRNVGMPLLRIVTNEVVDDARELAIRHDASLRIGTYGYEA